MQTKYSEPAFPLKEPLSSDQTGMTIRDFFAAQVISGFMPRFGLTDDTLLDYAELAYRMADAMMAARGE